MHVLVATDGEMDLAKMSRLVSRLVGEDGRVTVLTVMEIPRRMLTELRSRYGEQPAVGVDSDAEYVGIQSSTSPATHWPGDDAMIGRYLDDKREQIVDPAVAALRDAGATADGMIIEGENAAAAILEVAREHDVDAICVGSHGSGRFEGFLGSVGTRVTRHATCPVLVIR